MYEGLSLCLSKIFKILQLLTNNGLPETFNMADEAEQFIHIYFHYTNTLEYGIIYIYNDIILSVWTTMKMQCAVQYKNTWSKSLLSRYSGKERIENFS